MERVGVVVHPIRPVLDSVDVLASWSQDRGLELVQLRSEGTPAVAPAGEVGEADLIVALGGDGTMLKALHLSARTGTPVLGVAYGSLGALTAVVAEELQAGLDCFAEGQWRAHELPALVVRAGEDRIGSAVNDLVVARGRGTQLLVDVRVAGQLYVRLAGDGVAVATQLGSSAYSMAAGGPLLAEGVDAFVCTPLAMHGGCGPPVVVASTGEVVLEVHPGHSGFDVDIDGFPVETNAQRFAITCEDAYATLVALHDSPTGLARLRARGVISDSPRVLGAQALAQKSRRPARRSAASARVSR